MKSKHEDNANKSDCGSKNATLSSIPKSTSRWKDKRYMSAAGKAMKGGKLKK